MPGTEAQGFLEARNLLRDLREDYDMACRLFRWPHLDRFNWALDYFDRMAATNDRTALWIVDEAGGEVRLSFAELSQRSNQLANWWRALGVQRGDRILMMLGNIAPVWECLLAAMKLGAVIIPATTLLTRDDLLDRFARGGVRHVVTAAAETAKFAEIRGGLHKDRRGRRPGLAALRRGL
jgi:acetyl-CoA synthetase